MKQQQFCEPSRGKLVCQLPRGATFAYDLCLGNWKHCRKGISKDHNNDMGLHHAFNYNVPKHDPIRLNITSFVNPKVVSWYVNFLGA